MSKKVFGNRSNNLRLHIDEDHRISLKRASEDLSNQIIAKKSKPEAARRSKKDDLKNQENVTKTIERRVKSISLSKKSIKASSFSTVKTSPVKVEKVEISCEEKKEAIHLESVVEVKEAVDSIKEEDNVSELDLTLDESYSKVDFTDPSTYYTAPFLFPDDLEDFDYKHILDSFSEPHYAWDIFNYYKSKELSFLTQKYLDKQSEITKNMRAILVDWLVEVQQNFTLNHETLYLAVKIVDQYLMRVNIKKTNFQLLGATAILIAAKYDERIPPAITDFVYSCDNQYKKNDVILMEIDVLKQLNFNIGFPLSYRFLRRYARCAELSMEELTLARYILEMSLMEYELIEERESCIAAAALFLALRMKYFPKIDVWSKALQFYSGYRESDLAILMIKLNQLISAPPKQALSSIRCKYSHKIFMEVAKIHPLPKDTTQ